MKAQFKYAFLAGHQIRGSVFAVIFTMNLVFIVLGSLGLLPFAAHVTAVSLGGVAIAVMMAVNIIGDITIVRRLFYSPEAYLHALTPVPRWKTLLASIVAIISQDIVSMTIVITQQVWLSLNLAGVHDVVQNFIRNEMSTQELFLTFWLILFVIAGYLLIINLILFCVTAKRSIFFKKPVSGLLTFLFGCACVYIINLLQFILAPFGSIERFNVFFIITLSADGAGFPVYTLLILLEAIGLFVLTSKLMERRINI
jgi:hypothetical protein